MVIHTPRLCQDPAFLPPKEDNANEIKCKHIESAEVVAKFKEHELLQAEVLAAMKDHDITPDSQEQQQPFRLSEDIQDTRTTELGGFDETSLQHESTLTKTSDDDAKSNNRETLQEPDGVRPAVTKPNHRQPGSPDLETSANMLIRDIERQIAQGTFLTPQGNIATDQDDFTYRVALENVNGQVIGIVNVIVSGGDVRVEIEEQVAEPEAEDKQALLNKFPKKLMEELREFSGGLTPNFLDDVGSDTGESDHADLWDDDDDDDGKKAAANMRAREPIAIAF